MRSVVALTAAVLAYASAHGARADENLTSKEVLTVMVKRRVEIRQLCWEQSTSKADTSVKVDFGVSNTGIVVDATPRDAVGPPAIVSCIVAEVKKTTFPSSVKGGRFRWPFIFKGP
jgi:hypothetical protein